MVRMAADGTMHTLRKGTNGFTCVIMGTDKMCNDANSMGFLHAMMKKEPPPNKVGVSYMLAGDEGRAILIPQPPARRPITIGSSLAPTLWCSVRPRRRSATRRPRILIQISPT